MRKKKQEEEEEGRERRGSLRCLQGSLSPLLLWASDRRVNSFSLGSSSSYY